MHNSWLIHLVQPKVVVAVRVLVVPHEQFESLTLAQYQMIGCGEQLIVRLEVMCGLELTADGLRAEDDQKHDQLRLPLQHREELQVSFGDSHFVHWFSHLLLSDLID